MQNRVLRAGLFLLACLVVGALAGIFTSKYYRPATETAPGINGLVWPGPKTLETFTMGNQDNELFTRENLDGHWTFIFFGYTHCPDICPITLSLMDRIYEKLQENNRAENVQMVFVSVDPERDTPEKMASYIDYFNSDFTGLTGSIEQLETITRQMGIVYVHGDETAPGEYLVDHSASIFLISPQGKWVGLFSTPHDSEDIYNRFLAIRQFINSQAGT